MSTNLGNGVAIPHARCPGLRAGLIVFGQCPDGVAFGSAVAEPVRLVFLLVTPAEQPEAQLSLLAQVARVCSETRTREALVRASSPAEVMEILGRPASGG